MVYSLLYSSILSLLFAMNNPPLLIQPGSTPVSWNLAISFKLKMAPVLHTLVLQNFNGTDLLKPRDNLPGVGEQLDLCVVWSEAPEKTSSVPCCACNPAQTLFFFKG